MAELILAVATVTMAVFQVVILIVAILAAAIVVAAVWWLVGKADEKLFGPERKLRR